ncbi:hypothetical protein CR513_60125, partial [Mucuna pruriens]
MEGVQEDGDEEVKVEEIVRLKSRKRPTTSSTKPDQIVFKLMIEAVGNYGPHLKSSTYHELRVPLLKKELQYTKDMLKGHEGNEKYGCSIMSDGWTDKKNRTLINFLVNCSSGTMFVKCIDASEFMKIGDKEIGEKNVIQVMTDNWSNYVMAGHNNKIILDSMCCLLSRFDARRYWENCQSKKGYTKRHQASRLHLQLFNGFEHHAEFTNRSELVRHGVTRFVTTFLMLQRLHKQKGKLRRMFTSDG